MDYIGINTYRYVTGSTPVDTAYIGLAAEAAALSIPVFLSETGAVTGADRDWKVIGSNYSVDAIGEQISGETAFQLLEEGGNYGIYTVESGDTLTASAMGGHADLEAQFLAASTATPHAISTTPSGTTVAPTSVTMPASAPTVTPAYDALTIDLTWPDLLPLKTYSKERVAINVANHAASAVNIVQNGTVMANVAQAADPTKPTPVSVSVAPGVELLIQGPSPAYTTYCKLAGEKVVAGITVINNVAWGEACNI